MTETASTLRRVLAVAALAATTLAAFATQAATLRVTLSKAEVVTLDTTAAIVLIANPEIADVVLEQGHILFVLGKVPGETRLFVYDDKGNRLLERDVVVVPQNERAVTVTRELQATEYSCDPRCVAASKPSGTPAAAGPGAPPPPQQAPMQGEGPSAAAGAPAAGMGALAGH
jgi:hypothetical protein